MKYPFWLGKPLSNSGYFALATRTKHGDVTHKIPRIKELTHKAKMPNPFIPLIRCTVYFFKEDLRSDEHFKI